MPSLISQDEFEPVFKPLFDRKVGLVHPRGSIGDQLILIATLELFSHFGIDWHFADLSRPKCDVLVWGGGGNMGDLYPRITLNRVTMCSIAGRLGIPTVILPQSWHGPEYHSTHEAVFARERESLSLVCRGSDPSSVQAPPKLAPDLALGFDWGDMPLSPIWDGVVMLRQDREGLFRDCRSLADPGSHRSLVAFFWTLSQTRTWIITDRLHVAIAGLMIGKKVMLKPNSYHKNRSMYETWLKDFGCQWQDH